MEKRSRQGIPVKVYSVALPLAVSHCFSQSKSARAKSCQHAEMSRQEFELSVACVQGDLQLHESIAQVAASVGQQVSSKGVLRPSKVHVASSLAERTHSTQSQSTAPEVSSTT